MPCDRLTVNVNRIRPFPSPPLGSSPLRIVIAGYIIERDDGRPRELERFACDILHEQWPYCVLTLETILAVCCIKSVSFSGVVVRSGLLWSNVFHLPDQFREIVRFPLSLPPPTSSTKNPPVTGVMTRAWIYMR